MYVNYAIYILVILCHPLAFTLVKWSITKRTNKEFSVKKDQIEAQIIITSFKITIHRNLWDSSFSFLGVGALYNAYQPDACIMFSFESS